MQTFAVIRSLDDINSENLGRTPKDRFKPFFYSRKWEALGFPASNVVFEYPAVFVIDRSGRVETPFASRKRRLSNIQVVVVFPNVEKVEDVSLKAACAQLITDEIYQLTESLAYSVFDFVSGSVFAVTDKHPGGDWFHRSALPVMVTAGQIASYDINEAKTTAQLKMLRTSNVQASIGFVDDVTKDSLCGVSFSLSLVDDVCSVAGFDFNAKNCCAQI